MRSISINTVYNYCGAEHYSVEVEGSIQSVSYEVCAPGLVACSLIRNYSLIYNNYVLYGLLK